MRAAFKKGEWDQRRKSLIERKKLFKKKGSRSEEKALIMKKNLYRKRKLLKESG